MNDYRDRLKRGFFEVAVITVSILLAFALDRWWEGQLNAGSKQELISSLSLEFQAIEEALSSALRLHENRRDSARALSQLQASTIEDIDPEQISEYWYWTITPDETYPPSGALLSAISGGSLSLIDSEALKAKLSGWNDRLDDLTQTERVIADYTLREFWPSVSRTVVIPINNEDIGRETDQVILMPSTKNHLNLLSLGSDNAIYQVQELQREVVDILNLLDAEHE